MDEFDSTKSLCHVTSAKHVQWAKGVIDVISFDVLIILWKRRSAMQLSNPSQTTWLLCWVQLSGEVNWRLNSILSIPKRWRHACVVVVRHSSCWGDTVVVRREKAKQIYTASLRWICWTGLGSSYGVVHEPCMNSRRVLAQILRFQMLIEDRLSRNNSSRTICVANVTREAHRMLEYSQPYCRIISLQIVNRVTPARPQHFRFRSVNPGRTAAFWPAGQYPNMWKIFMFCTTNHAEA
jgi:hypothetical protein